MKVLAVVGGLLLTLMVGCAALAGVAVNEVDKELTEEATGDVSDPSEVKGRATVNEPLSLKGTTYQVTSVRTASSVGDEYSGATADGVFVIVDLSLTNEKNEPATIFDDALRVVGANGASYSVSDDALFAVDDQLVGLEEIQPGLTQQGTLVYDLPQAAISGAELQVEDLFSDDKGRIALGL